jgi:hypothetical protein
MLLFFIGLWPTLSHLKVGMLGCMPMSVVFPYQAALGGFRSGCLSPDFLSGVEPLDQAGSQKWSHEGLVNELSPAPSTHRTSL